MLKRFVTGIAFVQGFAGSGTKLAAHRGIIGAASRTDHDVFFKQSDLLT